MTTRRMKVLLMDQLLNRTLGKMVSIPISCAAIPATVPRLSTDHSRASLAQSLRRSSGLSLMFISSTAMSQLESTMCDHITYRSYELLVPVIESHRRYFPFASSVVVDVSVFQGVVELLSSKSPGLKAHHQLEHTKVTTKLHNLTVPSEVFTKVL